MYSENSLNNKMYTTDKEMITEECIKPLGIITSNIISPCITTFTTSSSIKQKELTVEEHLARVDEFITKHGIESDEKNIYLFKTVNLDGTNITAPNKITYEIGKTYVEKVNKDINYSSSYGLHAFIDLDSAIQLALNCLLDNYDYYVSKFSRPQNPSILYQNPNYKVFKVQIPKSSVIVPTLDSKEIRCSEMTIMEELKFLADDTVKYEITNLYRVDCNSDMYEYNFQVTNKFTGKSVQVKFKGKNNLSQLDIKTTIKSELEEMQQIYDQFKKCEGMLLK